MVRWLDKGRDEGRREGRDQGRSEILLELVQDGTLTLEAAARKAGKTPEEFQGLMKEIGKGAPSLA